MASRATRAAFLGSWRITKMEVWDRDAIDLLGPAFLNFDDEAMGEFRFIAVHGWIDCRFGERDGKPLVEFSWLGRDEADEASGRGWALIEEAGTMSGRIYIHQGDDSAFTAARAAMTPRIAPRRRPRLRKL